MKNKIIIKSLVILIIILTVLLIKNIMDGCILKINLSEIMKTNILVNANETTSSMHITEFINRIKNSEFKKAYEMTDITNSEYKFGSYDNFAHIMKEVCYLSDVFNDNYSINIVSTDKKDKYESINFEILFFDEIDYKKIVGVLREYNDNTYNIFITDYTEE